MAKPPKPEREARPRPVETPLETNAPPGTARGPAPRSYPDPTAPRNRPGTHPGPGDSAPEMDPTQARSGETGHNVRIVLAVAVLLVVLGFILAWLGFG